MKGETQQLLSMKVDQDGRVTIPQQFCRAVSWLAGTTALKAWLLLPRSGQHRLLSQEDVANNPQLEELRVHIQQQESQTTRDPLAVSDEQTTLPSRFFEVELSWSAKNGWRLTLPSITISLWGIERGKDSVAVLLSGGYIEIWSLNAVALTYDVPLSEIG